MSTLRNAQAFRAGLLSPVAFNRVKAMHALECQSNAIEHSPVGEEALAFVSRGIPYYSLQDAHYTQWVDQAVAFWEQVEQHSQLACAAEG